ncbi:MAG: hypothetical protein AAGI44_19845 [Pseudomonadota bacterium]
MHRSGTSLVARLARDLGADFGDERTFYPADKWNPDGYFEQCEILAINIPLINGPFGRFSFMFLPPDKTIKRRAEKLQNRIETISERYRDSVVKENRFCITLGAWRDLGCSPRKLLIVFRNPRSVAKSLKQRNKIPEWLAMRLWVTHYRRLLRHANGVPTAFLWYDGLLMAESSAARQHRCLAWFLNQDVERISKVAGAIVRPSPKCAPRNLPRDVDTLYSELRQMNTGESWLQSA